MKYSFLFFLIITCFTAYSQTEEEAKAALRSFNSPDSFSVFQSKYARWEIDALNTTGDELHPKLLKMSEGQIITMKGIDGDNVLYKLIRKEKNKEFRVSAIFFDGRKLTANQVDSLYKVIEGKYQAGTSFGTLAAEYAMSRGGGKFGGDLGWFREEVMVATFESAVKNHRKGDVFLVETPQNNWYHVVLKTHDDRIQTRYYFVKIELSE